MSDTDDQLEHELRELLNRVLSVQLDGLTGQVAELSASVTMLSRTCKDLPGLPTKLKELVDANEELAERFQAQTETLTGSIVKAGETSEQQGERLSRILAESRAALSTQILDAQSNIADACEALPAQVKAQAETSAHEVTKAICSAQEAAQQRDEKRGEFLADAIKRLAQSIDEKAAAQQTRLNELERKIGLLKALSIATLTILSLAAVGATALHVLAHTAHP